MSDIDEKKTNGKAGKRKKHAEQRNRKSDQKPQPKTDQLRSDAAPIASVLTASTEPAPIPAKAAETPPSPVIAPVKPVPIALVPLPLKAKQVQADTAILAAEAIAVAAQDTSGPSTLPMASVAAPVAAPDVRAPAAAPTMSAAMAPVAPPKAREQTVTSTAMPISAEAKPVPAAAPTISAAIAPVAPPKVREQTVTSTVMPISAEAKPVPAADVAVSLQTIANAYGEYTRKYLEQTKCFFDKLTGVRSLEQAVEIQTEFAKQTCETFVTEAQKIHDLHRELARQRFERLEGLITMGPQASY